jgi:hypothetical protein
MGYLIAVPFEFDTAKSASTKQTRTEGSIPRKHKFFGSIPTGLRFRFGLPKSLV